MQTSVLFLIVGALIIVVLVVLLAATRKSVSGPIPIPGLPKGAEGKYPYGYWMSIGITAGIAIGLALGLAVNSLVGGISIGIGLGLIIGRVLDKRYDKPTVEYTEDEIQERRRRATWGLILMILLVLGTLAAALLPLLQ